MSHKRFNKQSSINTGEDANFSVRNEDKEPVHKKRKVTDEQQFLKKLSDSIIYHPQRRLLAAQEILTTEATYVDLLKNLLQLYRDPMSDRQYLNEKETYDLFSNVESILKLSVNLLTEFSFKLSNWDERQTIGDVFLDKIPYMSLYSEYCSNYANAIKTLADFQKKKPELMNFIREIDEHVSSIRLRDLLILPIQRITRYRMLVDALIKQTNPRHPDYESLTKAYMKLSESNDKINNQIRQIENQSRVVDLVARITRETRIGSIIQPHRKYISDHILQLIGQLVPQPILYEDMGEKVENYGKKVIMIIFNDICVVAAFRKDTLDSELDLLNTITLHDSFLKSLPSEENIDGLNFQCVNPNITFTFRASSLKDKQDFKLSFNQALDKLLISSEALQKARSQIKLNYDPKQKMWEAIPCPKLYTTQIPITSLPKFILQDTIDALQNLEEHILMNRLHEEKPIKNKSIEKIKELAQIFSPQRKKNYRHTVKITSRECLSFANEDSCFALTPRGNEAPEVNLLTQLRTEISVLQHKYNDIIEKEIGPMSRDMTQVLLSQPDLTDVCPKSISSVPSQPNQPSLVSRVSFRLSPFVKTLDSPMRESEMSEGLKNSGKKRKCSEEKRTPKQPLRFTSSTQTSSISKNEKEQNVTSPAMSRTSSEGELPANKENQHPQSPRSPHKVHLKSLLISPPNINLSVRESTPKEKSPRLANHNRSISIDHKPAKLFNPLDEIPMSFVTSPQKLFDRARESSNKFKKRLETISTFPTDSVESTPFVML